MESRDQVADEMKFHDDDDVVMEMEESYDYDAEILVDMLSSNQPSPIKEKEFSLLLSPYQPFPHLPQLESAPRRSTGKWHRKGASWHSLRKERETKSPPTPIIQFDGDDSDSNYSDSFPEANNPQVLNLINLFNSFEDDFDDSDI